jgi:hypothetical protein
MTTLDIAQEALGIQFNKQGLLNFMLAYDEEHGADRDTSANSYDVIVPYCISQVHKFHVRYDKSYPRSLTPEVLPSAPHQECWGRITNMVKHHTDGRMIIQEIEIRKQVLEKLLKDSGFENKATCLAAWKKAGVIDVEDATHPCRKRKLDLTAETGSHEPVYVFRVFATDEDFDKITKALNPPKPKKSKLVKRRSKNPVSATANSKIAELLDTTNEEDGEDD